MSEQPSLEIKDEKKLSTVEDYKFEPIKGYPMLQWKGKRPFTSTQFYPAQLKENHGDAVNGWMNRIYWGDNMQVMAHLLKEFRGRVDLVYIDPPFDSKADYRKTINLKGKGASNDSTPFEEKQYTDIWSNDGYLQFFYERLVLIRELMAEGAAVFVHCDYHQSAHIKLMLDELFGAENFLNEIIWVRSTNPKGSQHKVVRFNVFTDTIYYFTKGPAKTFSYDEIRTALTEEELAEKYYRVDEKGRFYDGPMVSTAGMGPRPNLVYEYKGYTPPESGWRLSREKLEKLDADGDLGWTSEGKPFRKLRPKDDKGKPIGNFWNDISLINSQAEERVGYPTQKPTKLLERIIQVATKPNDLVFDCFMGSGTTQAAAMKLGRRFLGADINLGSIQTTTKRLLSVSEAIKSHLAQGTLDTESESPKSYFTGFSVYNVNHYDVFRNPVQAKELLIEALEIQPLPSNALYDGEKDGRMVKIMPINRIATKADINDLLTGFDYKAFQKRREVAPNKPVESLLLVCMGHEPDLAAHLKRECQGFDLDVEVVDILRDKANLEFKRDAQAEIKVEKGVLKISAYYPMNLLQKLSLMRENVGDWRELTESVMIDWNYDGAVFEPKLVDVPEKEELVKGEYPVPDGAGTIRVKLTDLLSESLEAEVSRG